MAKKTIFRENYLTHKPNGFTPDEYEKYGRKLDSHSFRKNINKEKENKEPQKESRNMSKNIIRLTESDLHRIVKESVQRILREEKWDLAAYENACDCLYYGYGFDFWRKQHSYLDPVMADRIWHAAFKKMAEDDRADFVPHSIESYDWKRSQDDERLNVQPDENGRYPDENLNVINGGGDDAMYAQGSAPSANGGGIAKLKGVKAIKSGGMGLADSMREFEKNFNNINKSASAKKAYDLGRLGNKKPLHRKGSLNRAFDK